jgi:hypothetical protein
MTAYFMDALYLFFFLGTFTIYRRLLLAEYQIGYLHYGVTLIEALVLAKILFLGRMMRLDRGFERKPLIFPTTWKSIVFSLLVCGFAILEAVLKGLIHGRGAMESLGEFRGAGGYDLLARCVVTFFALLPFFALKEIGQIMGRGELANIFFRKTGRQPAANDRAGASS